MNPNDEENKDNDNRTNNQNNTSASNRKNPGTGDYETDENDDTEEAGEDSS